MQITVDTHKMLPSEAESLLSLLAVLFPAEVKAFFTETRRFQVAANDQTKQRGEIKVAVTQSEYAEIAAPVEKGYAFVPPTQLDPADNPATGTASAAEVFTQGVAPQPAAGLTMTAAAEYSYDKYRAVGWTDENLIAHGLALPPAADTASTEAARVFGGAGGPLTQSSGEPPVPSNTGATSPLQSGDAMSVFAAPNATPAPSAAPVLESAAVTTTAPELDADGLPWDARIHASTRTKTAKGVWKKMRGVDDGLVAQVTSELRAAVATVKAAAFTPLNAPSVAPPPPPAATVAPPPPPPPGGTVPVDFVAVARFVGDHKITGDKVSQVCAAHGIAGLAMLTQHKDLCAPVLADFKKLVGVA